MSLSQHKDNYPYINNIIDNIHKQQIKKDPNKKPNNINDNPITLPINT